MKKKALNILSLFAIVTFAFSCGNAEERTRAINYAEVPFLDENGNINAIIEIPAGTNHKYEYDYSCNQFKCEIIDGKERVVKYLPYPGNYGFIPGTLMDKAKGGDGDALDVLVLCESLPQGKIIPIKPIAELKLLDRGEADDKIIAVPVDAALNTITLSSDNKLPESIKTTIKNWFLSYKGKGKMEFSKWEEDPKLVDTSIKGWVKK